MSAEGAGLDISKRCAESTLTWLRSGAPGAAGKVPEQFRGGFEAAAFRTQFPDRRRWKLAR